MLVLCSYMFGCCQEAVELLDQWLSVGQYNDSMVLCSYIFGCCQEALEWLNESQSFMIDSTLCEKEYLLFKACKALHHPRAFVICLKIFQLVINQSWIIILLIKFWACEDAYHVLQPRFSVWIFSAAND